MPLSAIEIESVLATEADHECSGVGEAGVCVKIVSIAELPTRFGRFQIVGPEVEDGGAEAGTTSESE